MTALAGRTTRSVPPHHSIVLLEQDVVLQASLEGLGRRLPSRPPLPDGSMMYQEQDTSAVSRPSDIASQPRRRAQAGSLDVAGVARGGRRERASVPPYRPRDRRPPINFLDFLDRHLSRATESDKGRDRYLGIITRLTISIGAVVVVGVLVLFGGGMLVLQIAYLPHWLAGLAGTGSIALTVAIALKRRRRILERVQTPQDAEGTSVKAG